MKAQQLAAELEVEMMADMYNRSVLAMCKLVQSKLIECTTTRSTIRSLRMKKNWPSIRVMKTSHTKCADIIILVRKCRNLIALLCCHSIAPS